MKQGVPHFGRLVTSAAELTGREAYGQQREGQHHTEESADRGAGAEAGGARTGTGKDADEEDEAGEAETDPEDVRHERGRDYRTQPPTAMPAGGAEEAVEDR